MLTSPTGAKKSRSRLSSVRRVRIAARISTFWSKYSSSSTDSPAPQPTDTVEPPLVSNLSWLKGAEDAVAPWRYYVEQRREVSPSRRLRPQATRQGRKSLTEHFTTA